MYAVNSNVYRIFAGLTGNQYLIIDPSGLALVDTGLPGSHRLILRKIQQLGYQPEDLKTILITHADPDHCGGAVQLREISGASIYTSRLEAQGLRDACMTRPLRTETLEGRIFTVSLPLFPTQVCEADFIISDGDELPFLGGLRVIESPGHTPGHLSFFAPQDRILFSGDTIDVNGGRLTPYQGDSTWDREEARRSFDKLMWLKPEIICGGHGFYRMR